MSQKTTQMASDTRNIVTIDLPPGLGHKPFLTRSQHGSAIAPLTKVTPVWRSTKAIPLPSSTNLSTHRTRTQTLVDTRLDRDKPLSARLVTTNDELSPLNTISLDDDFHVGSAVQATNTVEVQLTNSEEVKPTNSDEIKTTNSVEAQLANSAEANSTNDSPPLIHFERARMEGEYALWLFKVLNISAQKYTEGDTMVPHWALLNQLMKAKVSEETIN
jgi:hypothetical protein